MSRNPCIAVIDEREFRRAGLVRLLEPWASVEKVRIISFTPDQIEQWIGGDYEFKMLIFGIGGELLFESKRLDIFDMLRSRIPSTPLVVIADREDDQDIAIAMSKGAQGYISSGINSTLAFQALSFILHGGMYFPLSAFRKLHPGAMEQKENDSTVALSDGPHNESEILTTSRLAAGVSLKNDGHDIVWNMLTARQRQVLERICQGESNKMIGRHLGMTEGTVKVHVRQIMRKVGATNRTQLAIGKTSHCKKVES